MLELQHYTHAGWRTLGQPYPQALGRRVRRAAAELAVALGLTLRVVVDGREVAHWQSPAPERATGWLDPVEDFQDTMPLR